MPLDSGVTPADLDELTGIVSRAAAAILAECASGLKTRTKSDGSPVTAADEASEAIILEGLSRVMPGVPVISEEASGGVSRYRNDDVFALVDPLDGTRELVAGRDEYCINLAIVSGGRPRVGILAAPALSLLWRTGAHGRAERLRLAPGAIAQAATDRVALRPRPWPQAGAIAAISRSHLDAQTQRFLSHLPETRRVASGSAIKLCWVAEGAADVYPRLSPVSQWDVAAGDAILTAAGGIVTTPAGTPLNYGGTDLLVPAFVAWGDPASARRLASDDSRR